MPWFSGDQPAEGAYLCKRLFIPDGEAFRQAVAGALTPLCVPRNWEQTGTLSPEMAAALAAEMVYQFITDEVCMIGSIVAYASSEPPPGCLPCDGSTFSRADYPLLYAALDPAYIVDSWSFVTPDLRGRFVLAASLGRPANSTGGAESVTLDLSQIPPHTHTYNYPSVGIDLEGPGAPDVTAVGNPGLPQVSSSAGGGLSHENMPPYVALHYAIVAR